MAEIKPKDSLKEKVENPEKKNEIQEKKKPADKKEKPKPVKKEKNDQAEVQTNNSSEKKVIKKNKKTLIKETKEKEKEKKKEKKEKDISVEDNKKKDKEPVEEINNTTTVKEEKKTEEKIEILEDYSGKNKEYLLQALKDLVNKVNIAKIQHAVNNIKSNFYRMYRSEAELAQKKYQTENASNEGFEYFDPLEKELKHVLQLYRKLKAEYNSKIEREKEENLNKKQKIVEAIKNLVLSEESSKKTFNEFKSLQKKWFEIGMVPQSYVRVLWDTFNHHVENFYDYLKINKELRDLDYKKNLEAKEKLCEQAEKLLEETKVIEAFRKLQVQHQEWREIGPVHPKDREEIWQRFKEATRQINQKHQQYFVELKERKNKNLEKKEALCEKVEKICEKEYKKFKEWNNASDEIKAIQQVWKTIGFAPKNQNTKIYLRFRAACDTFFKNKREYNNIIKEKFKENLKLKKELFEQAEALKDSEDWQETTRKFIEIQKKWKEIGPVHRKYSNKLWNDFRAVCNSFFEKKELQWKSENADQVQNLEGKKALIEEMKNYENRGNMKENLEVFRNFQQKFSEFGFIPIKEKDKITREFRDTLNKLFDNLETSKFSKEIYRFKNKMEVLSKTQSVNRIEKERYKISNRISQLENNLGTWDNNIGFFDAHSENAEKLIGDFHTKIKKGKEDLKLLKEKLKIIDSLS